MNKQGRALLFTLPTLLFHLHSLLRYMFDDTPFETSVKDNIVLD